MTDAPRATLGDVDRSTLEALVQNLALLLGVSVRVEDSALTWWVQAGELAPASHGFGWTEPALVMLPDDSYSSVHPVKSAGSVTGRVLLGPFVLEETGPESRFPVKSSREMSDAAAAVASLVTAWARTPHAASGEERARTLEAQNRRLIDLDQLKSSFLAMVSHELRTPLSSIIGYSEMLADGLAGPLNPEQSEHVQTIKEKSETLLGLISSLLDISQIEAGRVRLIFEKVHLQSLIRTSVSSVAPQAKKKRVRLEALLPEADVPLVDADPQKLRQVLVNLIANAVKFTPEGGEVSVSLSEVGPQHGIVGEGYRLTVEDSGVGIAPTEFDRIFQTFYQVDSSKTREFGGAGLGLAIARSFIEGHQGQVTVESRLGQGSRFVVVLPASPKPSPSAGVYPFAGGRAPR